MTLTELPGRPGRAGCLAAALVLLLAAPALAGPTSGGATGLPERALPASDALRELPATDTLRGRVILGADSVPLAGVGVALHRVTTDSGTVADSATTDAEGRFTFRLERADPAVHLVSTRHAGVIYLGPPIHGDAIPDPYLVHAFETLRLVRPDTLPVAARHIILVPGEEGLVARDLIDMANASTRTLVSSGEGPRWEAGVPEAISGARVLGEGSALSDVRFGSGTVVVDGNIPPGGRRLPVAYRLAATDDAEWRLRHPTARFEVYLRTDAKAVEIAGLEPAGTSRIGGESYRRYVGRDLQPGAVVTLSPGATGGVPLLAWGFLGLGVVFGAAAVWSLRRGRATQTNV